MMGIGNVEHFQDCAGAAQDLLQDPQCMMFTFPAVSAGGS